MTTLSQKYVLKAMNAYPYELETAVEALQLALSYNQEEVNALILMGKIYTEYLQDYRMAKYYFKEAISINIDAIELYPSYAKLLILNEEYEAAEKVIKRGLTVRGVDKGSLFVQKAIMFEYQQKFAEAKEALNDALLHGYNAEFESYIKSEKDRIQRKMNRLPKVQKEEVLPQKETKKGFRLFF
ncbi:MAG: hypothetical protein N4A45_12410 [Flavobacteriales bacterium]|jgi:tetratricopeptide (TPR) repeat protein|nr:hypothetical protein [Flavobacteriales bacterium]